MMDPNELSRRGLEQLSNVTSRHHFLESLMSGGTYMSMKIWLDLI